MEIKTYINNNLSDYLQNVTFVNCDLDSKSNFESRFEKNLICGKYGYNSGSASLFYYAINYDVDKYKQIMILEWDVYFLCDNFYIYGSKYYGNIKLALNITDHLNGVAVYNRTPKFMEFIKKVNSYHKCAVAGQKLMDEGYDCVIHDFVKRFNIDKNLFIDSKYIINVSPKSDKNISLEEIKKRKPNVTIVHQKIVT